MSYNFNNGGQFGNNVSPYFYGNNYYYPQQPSQQPIASIQQPVQNIYEIPLRETKFVTSEQAKEYLVAPNTASLLIDKQAGVAYVKSANNMGQLFVDTYIFKKYDANQQAPQVEQSPQMPHSDTKPEHSVDLSGYVKKDDLTALGFVTVGEYNELKAKVDSLLKQSAKTKKVSDE